MESQVRVDKWLWAVRLYKTRAIATEACKKGRIIIVDIQVKPSRVLKIGDIIKVKRPPVTFTYKVLQLSEKRMGAKMVNEFVEDLTSIEELQILENQKNMFLLQRDRGTGRPTKKDRRDLDDFFDLYDPD